MPTIIILPILSGGEIMNVGFEILNQVGFDSPITDTERFLERQYLEQLL